MVLKKDIEVRCTYLIKKDIKARCTYLVACFILMMHFGISRVSPAAMTPMIDKFTVRGLEQLLELFLKRVA